MKANLLEELFEKPAYALRLLYLLEQGDNIAKITKKLGKKGRENPRKVLKKFEKYNIVNITYDLVGGLKATVFITGKGNTLKNIIEEMINVIKKDVK
jgi:hypothetical protein